MGQRQLHPLSRRADDLGNAHLGGANEIMAGQLVHAARYNGGLGVSVVHLHTQVLGALKEVRHLKGGHPLGVEAIPNRLGGAHPAPGASGGARPRPTHLTAAATPSSLAAAANQWRP